MKLSIHGHINDVVAFCVNRINNARLIYGSVITVVAFILNVHVFYGHSVIKCVNDHLHIFMTWIWCTISMYKYKSHRLLNIVGCQGIDCRGPKEHTLKRKRE